MLIYSPDLAANIFKTRTPEKRCYRCQRAAFFNGSLYKKPYSRSSFLNVIGHPGIAAFNAFANGSACRCA